MLIKNHVQKYCNPVTDLRMEAWTVFSLYTLLMKRPVIWCQQNFLFSLRCPYYGLCTYLEQVSYMIHTDCFLHHQQYANANIFLGNTYHKTTKTELSSSVEIPVLSRMVPGWLVHSDLHCTLCLTVLTASSVLSDDHLHLWTSNIVYVSGNDNSMNWYLQICIVPGNDKPSLNAFKQICYLILFLQIVIQLIWETIVHQDTNKDLEMCIYEYITHVTNLNKQFLLVS